MKTIRDDNRKPKHTYCTPTPPERSLTPELTVSARQKTRAPGRSSLLPDGTNPFILNRPVSDVMLQILFTSVAMTCYGIHLLQETFIESRQCLFFSVR